MNNCIMQLRQNVGKQAVIRYNNKLGHLNEQFATIVYVGKKHVVIRASEKDIPINRNNIKSVDYKLETT